MNLLPQEELELKVESLLRRCRTEVDIQTTKEQGALFREGPFQMNITDLAGDKLEQYQEELLYRKRNPYDVLLSVCADNNWSPPKFKAVDYLPGEGFLFSVVVNDHELVAKHRDRRPLLAAELASANFLRYLGLWVNVKNLNMYFDWEHFSTENNDSQSSLVSDLTGYIYFMGFNVIKTETTSDRSKTSVCMRPNTCLQLAKFIYVLLMSRGEKSCWLTDLDFEFFKRTFGKFELDESYISNFRPWKSGVICSCRYRRSQICFHHDEYYFFLMLNDYYYINKFGPVDENLIEKHREDLVKNYTQDTDNFYYESLHWKCPEPNLVSFPKECDPTETPINLNSLKCDLRSTSDSIKVEYSMNTKKEGFKSSLNELEKVLCPNLRVGIKVEHSMNEVKEDLEKSFGEAQMVISPKKFDPSEILDQLKSDFNLETEISGRIKVEDSKDKFEGDLKQTTIPGLFDKIKVEENVMDEDKKDFKISLDESQIISAKNLNPADTSQNSSDLLTLESKISSRIKMEDSLDIEKDCFKMYFDNITGLSNIKSSMGNWISVADISPSCNDASGSIQVYRPIVKSGKRSKKKTEVSVKRKRERL